MTRCILYLHSIGLDSYSVSLLVGLSHMRHAHTHSGSNEMEDGSLMFHLFHEDCRSSRLCGGAARVVETNEGDTAIL